MKQVQSYNHSNEIIYSATSVRIFRGDDLLLEVDKLSIFRGAKIFLIGNNGSGKTSLIKYIYEDVNKNSVTYKKAYLLKQIRETKSKIRNTSSNLVYEYVSMYLDNWWDVLNFLEKEFSLQIEET